MHHSTANFQAHLRTAVDGHVTFIRTCLEIRPRGKKAIERERKRESFRMILTTMMIYIGNVLGKQNKAICPKHQCGCPIHDKWILSLGLARASGKPVLGFHSFQEEKVTFTTTQKLLSWILSRGSGSLALCTYPQDPGAAECSVRRLQPPAPALSFLPVHPHGFAIRRPTAAALHKDARREAQLHNKFCW